MRRFGIAALLLLIANAAMAQTPDPINADRPGLADAAAVVGKGALQIESGLQWEMREDEDAFFLPTLFRVGLTRRIEARVEGNTVTSVFVANQRRTGLAPISFGAKVGIVLADDNTPGVSLIGRVVPKWGTNGFAGNHTVGDVRVAVDWDVSEHWSINPNAGWVWSDSDLTSFATGMFALTIGFAPRPAVSLFVDTLVLQREREDGSASNVWDAGVAYIPRQNWQFDVSAGVRTRGDTAARVFVAIGFAYRHH
jgi:hypothetical protein